MVAAIKGRSSCVLAGGQSEANRGSQVRVTCATCHLPASLLLAHRARDCGNILVQVQKKFILALVFSFTFMIVEVIGGYFANRYLCITETSLQDTLQAVCDCTATHLCMPL